jgi:hypothetical protein
MSTFWTDALLWPKEPAQDSSSYAFQQPRTIPLPISKKESADPISVESITRREVGLAVTVIAVIVSSAFYLAYQYLLP